MYKIRYMNRKPIEWRDSSLEDLKAFPVAALKHFGYELDLIQQGHDPTDFKAMKNLGSGIMELRKKMLDGAFRVVYVAKFARAIFVLHSFQKKTEKTAPKDLNLIRQRYQALVQELGNEQ